MRNSLSSMLFVCFLSLLNFSAHAESQDKTWGASIFDNLRSSIDFSTRPAYYVDESRTGLTHAVGIDVHKVFSSDKRDIGTLTAQAYLTRIDNVRGYPGFFDDDDDTELVYRIFNFNFTGLGPNLPNVKVGHLEVAYGLEQRLDTNGTLRQYGQPQNLGVKADWGLSLNKEHRSFEYEFSATTGGGQSLDRQDGSYVYAGRIGSSRDDNVVAGLSGYRSFLRGMDRERIGADLQYYFGRSSVTSEVSVGKNNDDDVLNALLEYNLSNRNESLNFYTQVLYLSTDLASGWARTINASLGVEYRPDTHLDLSAQYTRTMKNPLDSNPSTLSIQFRYRL